MNSSVSISVALTDNYYFSVAMPEVYNANPTVFSTSKVSKARPGVSHSLWQSQKVEDDELDGDTVEGIDSEEIFGTHFL